MGCQIDIFFGPTRWSEQNTEWMLGNRIPSTDITFWLYSAGDKNASQRLTATGSDRVCADATVCNMIANITLRITFALVFIVRHPSRELPHGEDHHREDARRVIGVDVVRNSLNVIRSVARNKVGGNLLLLPRK